MARKVIHVLCKFNFLSFTRKKSKTIGPVDREYEPFEKSMFKQKLHFSAKSVQIAFFIFSWDHIFAQRCHFSVLPSG